MRRNGERVHIMRGKLVWDFEPHDMPGAFVVQWATLYDADTGHPVDSRYDYKGPGEILYVDADNRRVIIGDKYSKATLLEAHMSARPDADADDYYNGWFAKRKPTATVRMSEAFIDGLREGWKQARER